MSIYDLIECHRKKAGLTNEEVSKALGHNSEAYFRMKMSRNSKFDLDELKKLIAILSLTDEEILNLFK